ncbi:MAG: CPBP family intramembrane metalloprotease [Spirochaetales bacterium]|nr:CPBP family intramembrane metalloprotease [Spirochaetales bacterium]
MNRKILFSALLIFVIFTNLSAQQTGIPDTEDSGLTHGEVLLYGGIPYLGTAAVLAASAFADSDDLAAGILMLSSYLLLNTPHCIIDPAEGLGLTALSAGGFAGAVLMAQYPELYGDQTLAGLFSNIGLKTSFWSYYRGYFKARQKAKPGIYPYELEDLSFSELFASPWNGDVLRMPSVWVPVVSYAVFLAGVNYLYNQWENAVWNTDHAYIGSMEVPILLGLAATLAVDAVTYTFTGVGEEALFRGVGYEELKISIGIVPAKIIDSALFSAVHIPQEIQADLDLTSILLNFSLRSAITLGLQWAYDKGGLKASVAQHMWIDVFAGALSYLLQAGVPDNDLALQLAFSYSF